MATLQKAAEHGDIQRLHGFGAKTEQCILDALRAHTRQERRRKRCVAEQYAEALVAELRRVSKVSTVDIAGSYRRCRETIGDIDIVVTAPSNAAVKQRFAGYDEVAQIVAQGDTRATVILNCGLQVDLRVVERHSYGAALTHFTGSREHNIALRKRARNRGQGSEAERIWCVSRPAARRRRARLDLLDSRCHVAKDEGVLIAINSDAHSIQELDDLAWGVGQARRGWLAAPDVVDTRGIRQLRRLLKRTM